MSATRTRLEYARVASMLIRTWNVAQGRTSPETHSTHLEEMVRLISTDAPDVVCLQELPVWSLAHLHRWSGLHAFGVRTVPALGGPLARRLTDVKPGLLRSSLTGQANAVLVSRLLGRVALQTAIDLNPRRFRRHYAAELHLPPRLRRAWGRERRIAQAVRLAGRSSTILVVNVHLTGADDSRPAEAELNRTLAWANRLCQSSEPVLLCGDMNLSPASSFALPGMIGGNGFSTPTPGIDQILGRGIVPARDPERWPDWRRRRGDVLLSDHAPIEAEMIRP